MVACNHQSDQLPGNWSAAVPRLTLSLCTTAEYLTKLSFFLKWSLAQHLTFLSVVVLLAQVVLPQVKVQFFLYSW